MITNLKIRKATITDSTSISLLLMLAMEEIVYLFLKEENYEKGKAFLQQFVEKESNQYSYQNCWVAHNGNKLVGMILIYDGAKLRTLRQPILDSVREFYNPLFCPEDETQSGEFYIDCFAILPEFQGQGIGTVILNEMINYFVINKRETLGLLVDYENVKARKLYLKLGFQKVGEKVLMGKKLEHLQLTRHTI